MEIVKQHMPQNNIFGQRDFDFGQRGFDFASALSHYIAVSHTDFFVTLSQLSCFFFFAFIALHDQHFETDENLSCRVDDSIIL